MVKTNVGWLIGRQNWAYKNLAEHNKKALPQYEHKENDVSADVVVSMYPLGLKEITERKKAILHLDSRRILGL
ncbi:MAG: hypothetical protein WC248_04675 [Candidatus Methanomethylophilaceae archaeon]|jgi:hypothetical protein